MIAIYSYLPTRGKEACGFLNTNDLAMFLSLSVRYSRKHFKNVVLVTNTEGKKILIDKYEIGFNDVNLGLNNLDIPDGLWAYSKLLACSIMNQPFVHIDLDCILWQRIPKSVLNAPMFFQHKELFSVDEGYKPLIKEIEKTTVSFYLKNQNIDYAFNCGVIGINDLSLVKKWKKVVDEFIFNPANEHFWDKQENPERYNYLFEQYFVACVAKENGVDAKFLLKENDDIRKPSFKMTHLWGKTKKSPDMEKIRQRLKREYSYDYKRINNIEVNEYSVFNSIYIKGALKYRALLEQTIRTEKVRSIVYMGYDDYANRYVNLDGTITDFLYTNATKNVMPECDLLIIKDMTFKWEPEDLLSFLNKPIPAKMIMDAHGVTKVSRAKA